MLIRLLAALALLSSPLSLRAPTVAAEIAAQAFSVSDMIRATALDQMFTQFAPAIAGVGRSEDISSNRMFLDHWEATARAVFNPDAMQRRLALALEGSIGPTDEAALGAFFGSSLGQRVASAERGVALLAPEAQLSATTLGQSIAATASSRRAAQLDAVLRLVSPEISAAMVEQSLRTILVGMAVAHQSGEIDVPWNQIDAQVSAMMPSLTIKVEQDQRSLMAYAYRDLSDADLDHYIDFLGAAPVQKFYGLAASAVRRIVTEATSAFGEAFASRMSSVGI